MKRALVLLLLFVMCISALTFGSVQGQGPEIVGQWSPVTEWPFVAIHTSVLPNGKVLMWSNDDDPAGGPVLGKSNSYIWDPATGAITTFQNNTTNVFCSGHTLMPDGQVFVTGGHEF